MQLCRDLDGTVTMSVYRKAKHTNQYLAFASHHPMVHKVAMVRTLTTRANALSSLGVERVEEDKQIVASLKENAWCISDHTLEDQDREWMTRDPE